MSKTICIVDDEESVIRSLIRVLKDEGYTIITATSPHEALEKMAAGPVDLIISDKQMPGMDGMDLLRRVAGIWPDSVRMLLSGSLGGEVEGMLALAMQEGVIHEYIHKPWENEELRLRIRKHLVGPAA
ncbi:MAG: response regulator [Candidatus Omnitrophica bacterium]|nr:response regulator [Candidatus Omnitrophota bacterium]